MALTLSGALCSLAIWIEIISFSFFTLGYFLENYSTQLIFFKGSIIYFSVDQNWASVKEIIINTVDSHTQSRFTDELGMVYTKTANDWKRIVITLVILDND